MNSYQRDKQADEICQGLAEQEQVFCSLSAPSWAWLLCLKHREERRWVSSSIGERFPQSHRWQWEPRKHSTLGLWRRVMLGYHMTKGTHCQQLRPQRQTQAADRWSNYKPVVRGMMLRFTTLWVKHSILLTILGWGAGILIFQVRKLKLREVK